jgi:hypothetical protein
MPKQKVYNQRASLISELTEKMKMNLNLFKILIWKRFFKSLKMVDFFADRK